MELHETWRWIIGGLSSAVIAIIVWRFSVLDQAWKDAVSQVRQDFKEALSAQGKFFTESIAADRLFLQTLIAGQQAQWEAAVQSLRDTIENARIENGAMRSRQHDNIRETNEWRSSHLASEVSKWETRDRSSAEYRERTTATLAEHAGQIRLLEERSSRLQQDFKDKLNKLGGS